MDEIKVICPYCLSHVNGNYGATKCPVCEKIFIVPHKSNGAEIKEG